MAEYAGAAIRTSPRAKAAAQPGRGLLRRDIGRVALLFTSVGSVIGSGWLLGALNATQVAGPAAIISGGAIGQAWSLSGRSCERRCAWVNP